MKFKRPHNRRFRLTPAVVRTQTDTGKLIDLYENAQTILRGARQQPDTVGPATLAKTKKEHQLLRAELRRRGFEAEVLDYDPEVHLEEVDEVAAV